MPNTISELLDWDFTIHATCSESRCGWQTDIDLNEIKRRKGPNAPVSYWTLKADYKCGKCGRHNLTFAFRPGDTPTGPSGSANNMPIGKKSDDSANQ